MHTTHLLHLSSQLTSFVVGIFLPVLVNLVTKSSAPSGLKRIVYAVLSAISAVVVVIATNGGTIDWPNAGLSYFITWVTSMATYLGLWTAAGQPGATLSFIRRKTGKYGIGPAVDKAA